MRVASSWPTVGAVRGLYFVGVDFQHRLGVDLGARGQQQVLVRQLRVAAVGAGADQDAAMERRAAAAGAEAAPEQVAARVARDVVDAQARVEVARAVGQQHAVGDAAARLSPCSATLSSWRDSARAEFQIEAAIDAHRAPSTASVRAISVARAGFVLHAHVGQRARPRRGATCASALARCACAPAAR